MIRDMLDCILIGGLVSFRDIWIIDDTADQIIIAISIAIVLYMILLFIREVKEWIKKYLRKSSAAQERW